MNSSRPRSCLAMTRTTAVYAVVLGALFVLCARRPLWHTDLWGHLAYGRYLWKTGALPATEPLLPLAAGVRFVDTAWLSQCLGYAIERGCGIAGLQGLFGGLLVLISAAWLALAHGRFRDWRWVMAGLLIYLWLDWFHLSVIRPQLVGTVCYIVLLGRLTALRTSAGDWLTIPMLFALWANLHGSVLMGLALLGAFLTGRGIDVLRRTGRLRMVVRDRLVRRFALWLLLAAAGGSLNPYGPALFGDALQIARNPNLTDLTEWQPLDINSGLGRSFAAVAVGLMVCLRCTPRRVQAWEGLLLLGLALGGLSSARLLTWWAPAAAYVLVLHARATWRKWRRRPYQIAEEPRQLGWTGVACVAAIAAFAASPPGLRLAGREPDLRRAVSSFTPVGAAEYLRLHPPHGLVCNTYEWGDYLLWAGPDGLQVMVDSHAHLIPPEVWRDYLRILRQGDGWRALLDRYDVRTVVVDPLNRESLIDSLRQDPAWRVVYEDRVAVVLSRP